MWGEYVPVSVRRVQAKKAMEKWQKKGQIIEPVEIEGRLIAKKFWGKKWCDYLELFADYDNRLPRGRTYARNGSISHLSIQKGHVEAIVSGSSLYKISINIKTLCSDKWETIKKSCGNQIGSVLEILQGKLSDSVMGVVADHKEGLFPDAEEMTCSCSCPDWAGICKHIAAVLYGIGHRLDTRPELLFTLRGVDPAELVKTQLQVDMQTCVSQLENAQLADIFGIDLEGMSEAGIKEIVKQVKTPKKMLKQKRENKRFDVNKITGDDLLRYRFKQDLTANQLAKSLGVTVASIYRWEKSSAGVIKLRPSSKDALMYLLNNEDDKGCI